MFENLPKFIFFTGKGALVKRPWFAQRPLILRTKGRKCCW